MYLSKISDDKIIKFVKHINEDVTSVHLVRGKTYVEAFTDVLDAAYHFSNYHCVNMGTGDNHSKQWRRFAINVLDKQEQGLGDEYLDSARAFISQDNTYTGSIL